MLRSKRWNRWADPDALPCDPPLAPLSGSRSCPPRARESGFPEWHRALKIRWKTQRAYRGAANNGKSRRSLLPLRHPRRRAPCEFVRELLGSETWRWDKVRANPEGSTIPAMTRSAIRPVELLA